MHVTATTNSSSVAVCVVGRTNSTDFDRFGLVRASGSPFDGRYVHPMHAAQCGTRQPRSGQVPSPLTG